MVNGISKKYRVKIISKYGYGTFEQEFTDLRIANQYALQTMMFDMATAGKLQDMVTITEIEEEEK